MTIPGSGHLLRYAGKRVVRELGLSQTVSSVLGLPQDDPGPGAAAAGPRPPRPLRMMDRATEGAVGERAFQASLAYLGDDGWSPQAQTSLAQAIAHAVVEALDEYLSRTARAADETAREAAPEPGAPGPA